MGVFGLERSHSPWLTFLHQRKIILHYLLVIEPVINSQWIINIGKIITKYVNLRRRWIINSNWLYSIDKPRRRGVAFTSNNLGRQCLYYFHQTIVHTLGVMIYPAPGLLALSRNRNVKVESKTKYVLFLGAIHGYLRQNKALIDGASIICGIICHNEHNLHRVWLVLQHKVVIYFQTIFWGARDRCHRQM